MAIVVEDEEYSEEHHAEKADAGEVAAPRYRDAQEQYKRQQHHHADAETKRRNRHGIEAADDVARNRSRRSAERAGKNCDQNANAIVHASAYGSLAVIQMPPSTPITRGYLGGH